MRYKTKLMGTVVLNAGVENREGLHLYALDQGKAPGVLFKHAQQHFSLQELSDAIIVATTACRSQCWCASARWWCASSPTCVWFVRPCSRQRLEGVIAGTAEYEFHPWAFLLKPTCKALQKKHGKHAAI